MVDCNTFPIRLTFGWVIAFSIEVALSIYFCDGHLIYTLDDPYIHLALAHNILRGDFGINLSEPSSPASSILWPWMLVPMEFIGLGSASPLILNALAAGTTVYVSARLLMRLGLVGPETSPAFAYGLGALLILVTSAIALPMTGMEHSWHVLTVVLTVDGLVLCARGSPPTFFFLAALVLMPLLRFEGAALSGASICALWFLGYRRAAVRTAALVALAVSVYSAYMLHLGLPILPSSALLKSTVAANVMQGSGSSVLHSIALNLSSGLRDPSGRILVGVLLTILVVCLAQRPSRNGLAVYVTMMVALSAHLLAGQYGWFARYEVYIMTLALLGLLVVLSMLPKSVLRNAPLIIQCLALAGIALLFVPNFVYAAIDTPRASLNIYEQQYQMHRFVTEYYKAAVAVNDLGLVSYGNDQFVLDLFGLGSERVRRLKFAGQYGPAQMATSADDNNVDLIMLYEPLFPALPTVWRKIAVLHSADNVTAAYPDVSFFVTPKANSSEILRELNLFRQNLPSGTTLSIVTDNERSAFVFNSGTALSPFLRSGWSQPEPWGTWSEGPVATLAVPRTMIGQGSVSLSFDITVFLDPTKGLESQSLQVSANGDAIATLYLDHDEPQMVLTIPAASLNHSCGDLILQFDLPNAESPQHLGLSGDTRQLAIGLRSMTVKPVP